MKKIMWPYRFSSNRKNCSPMQRLISRQVDGPLTPSEAEQVAAHLASCEDCRRWAAEEALLRDRLYYELPPRPMLAPATAVHNRQQIQSRLRRNNLVLQTKQLLQGGTAVALCAALILLFVLKPWQNSPAEPAGPTAQTTPTAVGQIADPANPVTLTMAGYPSAQASYEALAQQFTEQNPHILLQYVSLNEQSSLGGLAEQVALADVLLINGWLPQSAPALLQDITPWAAADPSFDESAFWPGLWQACGGVGMPLAVSVDLIFYDKAAFAAQNLPQPTVDWDWTTFQQLTEQLTGPSRYGFMGTGRPLGLLNPLVDAQLAAGTEPNELVRQLDWYVQMSENGIMPPADDNPQTAVTARLQLINDRQAAIWIGGLHELLQWQALFGDDLGVLPFPGEGTPARPTCAVISGGSTKSQAAWAWLQFLSQQAPISFQNDIPARPLLAQSVNYWQPLAANTAVAVQAALANAWYGTTAVAEVMAVGNALIQALNGETPVVEVITQLAPTAVGTAVPVATPLPTPTANALPSSLGLPERQIVTYHPGPGGGSYYNQAALENLVQTFNAAQDSVEVRLNRQTSNTFEMAVEVNDCFAWSGTPQAYTANWPDVDARLYNLTPLFLSEESALRDDFTASLLADSQIDGDLYALPLAVTVPAIRYNPALFAEMGVEVPSADWTLEQFWQIATAVSRNDPERRIYGFVPQQMMADSVFSFVPNGTHPFDPYDGSPEARFTDPAVVQGVQWLVEMVNQGVMYPLERSLLEAEAHLYFQKTYDQELLIKNNQAAMWFSAYNRPVYDSVESGTLPLPISGETLPYQPVSNSAYISKQAENPQGCWEWIKFLSAQPNVYYEIPARESVRQSEGWRQFVGPANADGLTAVLQQPVASQPVVSDPGAVNYPYAVWWAYLLQDLFAGADITDSLEATQALADSYLACLFTASGLAYDQVVACAEQVDPTRPWPSLR